MNAVASLHDDGDWNVVLAANTAPGDTDAPTGPANLEGSSIQLAEGGSQRTAYRAHQVKEVYVDENAREPLLSHLVRGAIAGELN